MKSPHKMFHSGLVFFQFVFSLESLHFLLGILGRFGAFPRHLRFPCDNSSTPASILTVRWKRFR